MGNLLEAAEKGNSKLVKKFLREGADLQQRDLYGATALHKASQQGHVEIVSTLLSEGANVNIQNKNGSTPLHQASSRGHSNVAQVLIRGGANVNAQRNDGDTPLHRACYYGNPEVVTLLINEGASVNFESNNGETSLHRAVVRFGSHPEVVSLLLTHGAKINAQNKNEETPLHRACELEDLDFVGMLVRAGADLDIRNNDKNTPVDIARHKFYPRGVELLEVFVKELDLIKKSQGQKLNQVESQYTTLLQSNSQSKMALSQVADDAGLDYSLFEELQLLRRSMIIRMRHYEKTHLRDEIKKTTDRHSLRSLGEQLRAIPFDEKDLEGALSEQQIKDRGLALLAKFEERWGSLLADREDTESFERCRQTRDEFELLFRDWCAKQSEELVHRLEDLINHWKELHPDAAQPQLSAIIPNTPGKTSLADLESSFSEMTELLPEEMKSHYQGILEKMRVEIPAE